MAPRDRKVRDDLPAVVSARLLFEEKRGKTLLPGVAELEGLLPQGGLPAGSLVDLHADEGAGALALALAIAARQEKLRSIVVVDSAGDFYPPAAAHAGIDLERLIILKPPEKLALACLDEALRTKAVAATIARIRGLAPSRSHRLRVAAETGGGLGLIVRPKEERSHVSAAAVRILVEKDPGRGLVLTPLRVRGGMALGPIP